MTRYIVEFDNNISETKKLTIIQTVNAIHVSNIFQNFELIECDTDTFELLKQHDAVITIELDGLCEAQDAEPADFPNNLINVLGNAHKYGFKGDDVVIAVIDSGVNYEHEDLQFEIYKCAKILNGVIESVGVLEDVKDTLGHGTYVTSVIAMQDNDIGYVGVAPNAKLMIIKAVEVNGGMTNASMVKGITWAVDNGAKVINVSYSQTDMSTAVMSACEYALNKGCIVVSVAGNNGNTLPYPSTLPSTDNVHYWKSYPGTIVVGAVKERDNYNGMLIPELPVVFTRYSYSTIYYNDAVQRYRLILSDNPTTIEGSQHQAFEFTTVSSGFNEYYDYYPNVGEWQLNGNRSSTPYVINWSNDVPLSPTYPDFVYTNHEIIDNKNGGIVHTPVRVMENYHSHLVTNFGHFLDEYYENNLQNIIKAPYSSFGTGIDFVAPGYFNLAKFDVNDAYRIGNGTSYSAPVVTGIIAILKQRFPHFTHDEIYRLLKDYAVVVGDGNVNYYGNGLVTMPDMSKLTISEKVYHKGTESKLENFLYLTK